MIELSKDNVVKELVKRVPELNPIYQDEMDYYGEISNYVFFGAILSKFIVEQFDKNNEINFPNRTILAPIFSLVEECVESGDLDLRDLILAGFLESFILTTKDYPILKDFLGEKTKDLLSLFE